MLHIIRWDRNTQPLPANDDSVHGKSLMVGSQFALDGIRNPLSLWRMLAWHTAGLLLVVLLPSLMVWQGRTLSYLPKAWPMLMLTVLAYLGALSASFKLRGYPRTTTFWLVFSCATLGYLGVICLLAFSRAYYSRTFLLVAYCFSLVWLAWGYRLSLKTRQLSLELIPGGMAEEMKIMAGVHWFMLQNPGEHMGPVDGVVVDLHQRLSPKWIHYISDCTLKRIPIYHAAVVFETLTGRVSLSHLSAGVLEDFRIPPLYTALKRLGDVFLVLISAPFVLMVLLIVAAALRLDSPGPVFFWQDRVGQGGRKFRMVKFRSMHTNGVLQTARYASEEKSRISRVGGLLRRFRIDELPQVWNVLKGDMSLIGPRPEQIPFARNFESEIPFYTYRHLVKPGLTGWAQVCQGYAAGVDETRRKLEFDLYYIKYHSFWLDIGILGRTLRTVLTGDGPR